MAINKEKCMERLDFRAVQRHINILNVAYHLCLEIVEERGYEHKVICPFCGYNKNAKIPTMSLNSKTNKYCCFRCGAGRIFNRTLCKNKRNRQ